MGITSFSQIQKFGFRNALPISFTIACLLIFSSHPSWANHPESYSTLSQAELLSSPTKAATSFFDILDNRFSSEIKNKFSDHITRYNFYFWEPISVHSNNKMLQYEATQDIKTTTQSALQTAFSKTINQIRWVLRLKDTMNQVTSTQVRIPKDFLFQGDTPKQNSLNGLSEENYFFIANLSLAEFPSLGIKLHTSNQHFETSLKYIPQNSIPFSVRMERTFTHNSKIGINYSWSNHQNNLYSTLLFNF